MIDSQCFQTGWRIAPNEASFEYSNDLRSDLVTLQMDRFVNGPNVAKEYFVIADDRVPFVRIESDWGEAVQNNYVFPIAGIGMVPKVTTADEWARLLKSSDRADVLSGFVFLGGWHFWESEQSKYSRLFGSLVNSPVIRGLIHQLCQSDNEWVRQEAQLAARSPGGGLIQ